jgi:hypothetical protein
MKREFGKGIQITLDAGPGWARASN